MDDERGEDGHLPGIERRDVVVNGVRLHVVQAGPVDGPIVILLHGFPEFWFGWRHQIRPLIEAGYRVWVPDQRGYNRSEKPAGVEAYAYEHLVADVVGLIDATGRDRVALVGHDWGAGVAWWTAEMHPDRVERLVAINHPYRIVMNEFYRHDRRQLLRGWYVFFFQVPALPELLFGASNGWLLARGVRATGRPDAFPEEDMRRYRLAWSRPNALTSMLNLYRAALRYPPTPPDRSGVEPPTLVIWGENDVFFLEEMAHESMDYCDDGRLVVVDGATHWVHHEEPDRVNELVLEFLETEP